MSEKGNGSLDMVDYFVVNRLDLIRKCVIELDLI